MGPGWRMHFAALLAREVLLSLLPRAPFFAASVRPSRPRPSDCHFLQPRQSARPSVCLSARLSLRRRPPSRARAPRTKNPEKLSAAAATCNCVRSLVLRANMTAWLATERVALFGPTTCSLWNLQLLGCYLVVGPFGKVESPSVIVKV